MHQTKTISGVTGWRQSAAAGLRAAWRERRLVLTVWLTFLLLAAFASVPLWRACDTALSYAPEGDRLLTGLKLPLLMEIVSSEGPASPMMLPWMLLASLLAALAWNPFVSGGAIAVLAGRQADGAARDEEKTSAAEPARRRAPTVRERFFAGGARHYWALARLLGLVVAGGFVLLWLVGAGFMTAMSAARERGWEHASLALFFANLGVLAALAGVVSLVLDIARIATVRDGVRTWRAIKTGLRMLFRHGGTLLAFGLAFGLLLAAAIAIFLGLSRTFAVSGWTTILLGVALQQAFALVRTGLRVAMLAGELRMLPPPPPPPVMVAAPPEPVVPVEPTQASEPSARPTLTDEMADLPPLA